MPRTSASGSNEIPDLPAPRPRSRCDAPGRQGRRLDYLFSLRHGNRVAFVARRKALGDPGVSREHRALVSGWIVGATGIIAGIGWASSWNAYFNLLLTLGTINLAIVAWVATNR